MLQSSQLLMANQAIGLGKGKQKIYSILHKLEKSLNPREPQMMLPPGLQILTSASCDLEL